MTSGRLTFFSAILVSLPLAVSAGEWKGEAAAGLLLTSGNSETESANGKFELIYLHNQWKNRFTATAINSGDEMGRTVERYTVSDQLDYNFTERDYAFAAIDYERDRFGGFRQRTVESLGYGRHVLTGPEHILDVEIGAGARQTEEQDTGMKEDEVIGRLGGRYLWTLTETSSFGQTLRVEGGENNTFTEAVTELKMSIIGNLFAAVLFTVRNNTDVPPDTEKTDTITAVNLSYSFGSK